MNQSSFDSLINSEESFDRLLKQHGLTVDVNDKLHRDYALIRTFNNIRGNAIKSKNFLSTQRNNTIFAITNVISLQHIIRHLSDYEHPSLKGKLSDILQIINPDNETIDNNHARNTLFELLLLGHLRSAGLNAELGKENPDIIVTVQGRCYFIQCKRIFSKDDKAIRNNVVRALEQLNRDLKKSVGESYGVIALSVEKFINQAENIWEENATENVAKNNLQAELRAIANGFSKTWQDKGLNAHNNICGVLLHNMSVNLIQEPPVVALGQHLTVTNFSDPPSLGFEQLKEDIVTPLLKVVN